VYTKEQRSLLPELQKYNNTLRDLYEKDFRWQFDEKATLILASPQNQIANGYATIIPRLHTLFYGAGPELIDAFSANSWLYVLLSHETAHLYQMNAKGDYAKSLKKIFGQSQPQISSILPPFTYVEFANLLLPTFISEGNAVFNESRFGNGGRLYSGAARALVLQLARAGHINSSRLMNDHIFFPYSSEKYLVGGFLFFDLAKKYGVTKTNNFFYTHAKYEFNPLAINQPFLENFGVGYEQAINDFVISWRPLWQTQKSSSEKALFSSTTHAGITKDTKEIRLLTTDEKKIPQAHIFNLETEKWSTKSVNMPLGLLFRNKDGELISTSSEAINNHQINYGLFGEGYKIEKESLGKYYYDVQGDKKLWAEIKSSFFAPDLYAKIGPNIKRHEYKHFGFVASSGIINGNDAYYFKQEHKKRTLYRDNKPLFSFSGYYGFPADINEDNIYFIGPTERGTSLFLWRSGKFFRAHISDTIVDATLLNEKKALIAEITAQNYEYKIVNLNPTLESPFEYKYFTESEPEKSLLSNVSPPDISEDQTISLPVEKKYRAFSQWQFDGIDPLIFFGTQTPATANLIFHFSDPLQFHSLNLKLANESYGVYGSELQYINSRYIVNWDVLGSYFKNAALKNDKTMSSGYSVYERYDRWVLASGFDYLFYKRPLFRSSLASHFIYTYENPHVVSAEHDNKYSILTQLKALYSISPALAYSPYKLINFELADNFTRNAPNWSAPRSIYGAQLTGTYDIFRETYLSATYQVAAADNSNNKATINFTNDGLPYSNATEVSKNTRYLDQDYFEVRKISAELKQAINWGFYPVKFPLGLRRMALVTEYNEYHGSLEKRKAPNTLFHELGAGFELELLTLHRFPFRLKFLNYESSYKNGQNIKVILGANNTF
ncbi:MAG: hypothetical protein A2Z20_07300, partial [Bdellovibrionales bacterium RBG_16_40_8]